MNNEDQSGQFFLPIAFVPVIAAVVACAAVYVYEWAVGMHDFSGTELGTGIAKEGIVAATGMGVANNSWYSCKKGYSQKCK